MSKRFYPYPASQAVLEKIEAKHGIRWGEIEEVFRGKMKLFLTHRRDRYGEPRYLALGRTSAGRYLTVFFVGIPPDQAKVISSRDMDLKERKWFGK